MYGSVIWISYKNYKIKKKQNLKHGNLMIKTVYMYDSVMWISYKNKKIKKNLKHENFWV